MPASYEKQIAINAPPGTVWPVMARVEGWPDWTQSIKRIIPLTSGEFGVGSRARFFSPVCRRPSGR